MAGSKSNDQLNVERVQTGVRIEKRLLKVMKGMAEYHDMSLGNLLEGIVLHAFEGRSPFSKKSLKRIKDLKKVYGVDYGAERAHPMTDTPS